MAVETMIFGHPVRWCEELEDWFFIDTGQHYKEPRKCPQCNELPTPEGYDPCIGKVEGAIYVCCGHGVEKGWVMWDIDENWYDGWTSINDGLPEENELLVFEYHCGGITSGYYYEMKRIPFLWWHRRFHDYHLNKSAELSEVKRWKYL